jgi:serine/threonine protein kinase
MSPQSANTGSDTSDTNFGMVLAGQYKILSLIGKGGMGTVYKGIQISVSRPVAIKLISQEMASHPGYVKRFKREAQLTSRLSHPHNISLIDFGETDDGLLYLIMEMLEGSVLSEIIRTQGPLSLPRAINIATQIGNALQEAHRLGVTHRDLKPDNIFIRRVEGENDFVKVMDFGIAAVQEATDQTKLTSLGTIVGTPEYMSPEQAQGEPADFRSDLYSLGIILFEMITGQLPFQASTPVPLLMKHISEPPPRLSELTPDLPNLTSVQALLDKLLAKKAAERPSSAAETVRLMRNLIDNIRLSSSDHGIATNATLLAGEATINRTDGQTDRSGDLARWVTPLFRSTRSFFDKRGVFRGQILKRKRLTFLGVGIIAFIGLVWSVFGLFSKEAEKPAHIVTAAAPETKAVTIISKPSDARITIQGAELGRTPYVLRLKETRKIQVSMDGYKSEELEVSPLGDPIRVVHLVAIGIPNEKVNTESKKQVKSTASSVARDASRKRKSTGKLKRAGSEKAVSSAQVTTGDQTKSPETRIQNESPRDSAPVSTADKTVSKRVPVQKPDLVTQIFDDTIGQLFGTKERRSRRTQLARSGTKYQNVAQAKAAYNAGKIDRTTYDDVIWVLKTRRKSQIQKVKSDYRAGRINKAEYNRRIQAIDRAYLGK